MDGGAWWATVHGVAKSWTQLSNLTFNIHLRGKITRPFRYDLNQIPYDYTVEVTSRFKGLDLVDSV